MPIDNERIDEWQKKWMAMPEHRTKYEHLKDAPNVVGEELVAMTNDIVDFCQKQTGSQSYVFKSIKENVSGFLRHPAEFLKKKAEEDKKKAMELKETAVKKSEEAKEKTSEAKGSAEKKVKSVADKTKNKTKN